MPRRAPGPGTGYPALVMVLMWPSDQGGGQGVDTLGS